MTTELLDRVVDPTGHTWATLAWEGTRLVRLAVPGAVVDGRIIDDALLGRAHPIASSRTTTMSVLDWSAPTEIPTIAAPAALAPSAGGTILNTIAMLAERAGVVALRYAGPYPTSALWHSLRRSFRTQATEDDFVGAFASRAAQLARDPMPIDFVPAPHERIALGERGHLEKRARIERVVLEGVPYEHGGSPARLIVDERGVRCEVWFGDARYAHVATIAPDGTFVDGPHPIPSCKSDLVRKHFPPALAVAIGSLVAEAVPRALAADVEAYFAKTPIRWDDLGARAAFHGVDAMLVHAAIWERIAPLGLGRVALAVAEALTPVVTRAVLAEVMSP